MLTLLGILKKLYEALYQSRMKKNKEMYDFLSTPVYGAEEADESTTCFIPETAFQLGNFQFNVLDRESTVTSGIDAYAYFTFMCLAYSDEEQKIVYMYYFEESLDEIIENPTGTGMEEFVAESFPAFWLVQ